MNTLEKQIREIVWKLMVGVKMGKIEPKDEVKYVDDILSLIKSIVPEKTHKCSGDTSSYDLGWVDGKNLCRQQIINKIEGKI